MPALDCESRLPRAVPQGIAATLNPRRPLRTAEPKGQPFAGYGQRWQAHPQMEAKDDDHDQREPDEPAPPLAPTLKIVAKQFLARRAALGEAALDCDGIECLYGDFVDENADEFEGFDPSDGSGNDHALKALHEEFLELFTRDVEGALADSSLTLEDFVKDVEEARRDGEEPARRAATAVWFCGPAGRWAHDSSRNVREAAQRQQRPPTGAPSSYCGGARSNTVVHSPL